MSMFDEIVKLSHEFGTRPYVKSGGGNTSVKDTEKLWIKPSGTVLLDMAADSFVGLNRVILRDALNNAKPEDEGNEAEFMMPSVLPGQTGRPSVESPIHNLFEQAYIVHNHPPMINGMTCAQDGKAVCADLFPEALWLDFVDPGITLWTTFQREMSAYTERNGKQPEIVMVQNHGVFVASDSPDRIREIFLGMMGKLSGIYEDKGIALEVEIGPEPGEDVRDAAAEVLRAELGDDASFIVSRGPFKVAEGPLTPDHIVYERAYKCVGNVSAEAIAEFEKKHSCKPRVCVSESGVFATGPTERKARDAMDLAIDGAEIRQFAEAFGGVRYLSEREAAYIEGWEVEKYRQSVS